MDNMQTLIGKRVKSSTAADTRGEKAPRDHVIERVWFNGDDGKFYAWSANRTGGEHLSATSESQLIRRIMSLG